MNKLTKKNKIKDYVIISLVKTLAETYSLNYNIDKTLIENNILDKLNKFNILDSDFSENVNFENKITKFNDLTDISKDRMRWRPALHHM